MNVWKLSSAGKLDREECEIPAPEEGKRKVRVIKVMLNSGDAFVYGGASGARFPVVPGRFAIGMIADENGSAGFEKGTKVLLHTFVPAQYCGTDKADYSKTDYEICGQTTDGYLRDFLWLSEDDMTPIPESVSEKDGLLVEILALAKATADALDVQKGNHIAVIGGDLLGLMICQLLMYQQVSPILIDNSESRLEFARSIGIYYTALADERLLESIGALTGGRLADGSIYVTSAGQHDTTLPFAICAKQSNTVFSGFYGHNIMVNLDLALKNQITVYSIADGSDYVMTAMNLLANKAVDTSPFTVCTTPAENAQAAFEKLAKNADIDISELNIISLV